MRPHRIGTRIVGLMSGLSAVAMAAMALVTVIDVVMKNLFNSPIEGSFEAVEITLVIAVFMGIPATFLRNGNVVVDLIDHFVPAAWVRRLEILAQALSMAFLVILIHNMLSPAFDSYESGEIKEALGMPVYYLWLPIIVGSVASVVALVLAIGRGFGKAAGGRH